MKDPEFIDTLIFDLDGTLVDTLPDLADSVNKALAYYGFPTWEENKYRSFLGNGSDVLISKALGKANDTKENHIKVFNYYIDYYFSHVSVKSRPFDGMKETLVYLKSSGYQLFCLTNKPDEAANRLVNDLFGNIFTYVLGNSSSVPTKPDPYGMNFLVEKFSLNRKRIAYFGDSDVDIVLAANARISHSVACLYGYRDREELISSRPFATIERPRDILSLSFIVNGLLSR